MSQMTKPNSTKRYTALKALNEVVVIRPTSPCYNNTIYKTKHKIHIYKNESKHGEMGPVKQNLMQFWSSLNLSTLPHGVTLAVVDPQYTVANVFLYTGSNQYLHEDECKVAVASKCLTRWSQ